MDLWVVNDRSVASRMRECSRPFGGPRRTDPGVLGLLHASADQRGLWLEELNRVGGGRRLSSGPLESVE